MTDTKTTFDSAKPLYAVVGASGAAYQAVTDAAAELRSRSGQARTDVTERFDARTTQLREQLTKLQNQLPDDLAELRDKVTATDLKQRTETYRKEARELYTDWVDRGEASVENFRTRAEIDSRIEKIEELLRDLLDRTDDVIDTVAEQAKSAGARASKLVGREIEEGEDFVSTTVDKVADAAKRAVAAAQPK